MDVEKALKLIENNEWDTKIKNHTYKGIQILSKFVKELDFVAGHDIIYVCDFESTVEKMSEEEVKTLAEHGFFCEEDSWAFCAS